MSLQYQNPEDFNYTFDQFSIAQKDITKAVIIEHNNNSVDSIIMTDPGLFEIKSTQPLSKKSIVISSGIHGNEIGGIHIANTLLSAICNGEITVKRNILITFGNLKSIEHGCRFMEYNLNRLFHSSKDGHYKGEGSLEDKRSEVIMNRIQKVNPEILFDLHQTFNPPQKNEQDYCFAVTYNHDDEIEEFCRASAFGGLVYNKLNEEHTTFTGSVYQKFGIPTATLEIGKIGTINSLTIQKTTQNLMQLIEGKTTKDLPSDNKLDLFNVAEPIMINTQDFVFEIDDKTDFAPIPTNLPFAKDGDTVHEIQVEGSRILFASADEKPGERAGLIITPLH